MRKFHRSLLWSGLVAAGLAACGDDVTVTPPAEPVLGVHSISVGPNPADIQVGQNLQMTASVNADVGIATTVTWRSTNTNLATVSGTGLVAAVAAGTVAIEACSTVNTAVCGNATVRISTAPTATVTQVNVTPSPTGFLVKPASGSASLQLSAAVVGTNNPSQTVTWSIPGTAPAGASISAAGLVTITAATPGGSFNVSACSTVAGYTNVCGFTAVQVQVPTPATVSIKSVTWVPTTPGTCTPIAGAPEVTVLYTNVMCQIQVTANVNAGDVILQRVDVVIGGQVVGSQTFPGTAAANGGASVSAPVDVTIPVNTQQLRRPTGSATLFVPVLYNGNQFLSLNLYTSTSATPLASAAQPVVLNNPDAMLKNGAAFILVNNSSSPSYSNISGTWFTGTQSGGTVQYISFSTATPTGVTFTSTGCGGASTSNTGQITGSATAGIVMGANWSCAGYQGGNSITGVTFASLAYTSLLGPDGTPVTKPVAFSNVGSAFTMPTGVGTSESRWNMITGTAPTASNVVLVDNVPPVITPNEIGFRAGCSATIPTPGCWINGSYSLTGDFPAVDGGTGVASINTFSYVPGPPPLVCTSSSLTPANAPEDASPTKYNACAVATDNLGNSSTAFGFNAFGVDKTNPTISYAKDPAVVPALYTPNSTLAEAIPAQALDWSVNDNNSGLDTATALSVSTSGTVTNGACGTGINAALNAQPAPGAARFMIPANVIAPDRGCGVPGYYHYLATVTDRAGNSASDVDRIFGFEPGVPSINAIAPAPLYGGGTAATITMFASHTGASLSAAKMGIWYTSNAAGPTATPVELVFDMGQMFNAPFQTPLFLATPTAGTPMTVAAGNVLAGLVIDSTQVPVSSFDSLTAIVRDVFDASNLTGALVHADTADLVIPAPFIDATKVSTSASVWANPNIGAATFSGSGSCTFTYATPTNGPTIPTSVLVVSTTVANIYDVLFPITSSPTLQSDNGTTRLYQYSVSSGTCASLGGTLKLIAVKNDGAGLPVGYLVP